MATNKKPQYVTNQVSHRPTAAHDTSPHFPHHVLELLMAEAKPDSEAKPEAKAAGEAMPDGEAKPEAKPDGEAKPDCADVEALPDGAGAVDAAEAMPADGGGGECQLPRTP